MKILILDDESAIKENLDIFLEDEGFEITSTDTAEKALEIIKSGVSYNVAIVDIRLPNMSGDNFIKEASKIDPYLRFIIHTGSLDFEVGSDLLKIGITKDNLFRKPIVNINSLIKKINELAEDSSKSSI